MSNLIPSPGHYLGGAPLFINSKLDAQLGIEEEVIVNGYTIKNLTGRVLEPDSGLDTYRGHYVAFKINPSFDDLEYGIYSIVKTSAPFKVKLLDNVASRNVRDAGGLNGVDDDDVIKWFEDIDGDGKDAKSGTATITQHQSASRVGDEVRVVALHSGVYFNGTTVLVEEVIFNGQEAQYFILDAGVFVLKCEADVSSYTYPVTAPAYLDVKLITPQVNGPQYINCEVFDGSIAEDDKILVYYTNDGFTTAKPAGGGSDLTAGCGIDITSDVVSVDNSDLAGSGLVAGTGCSLDANLGDGLTVNLNQIQLNLGANFIFIGGKLYGSGKDACVQVVTDVDIQDGNIIVTKQNLEFSDGFLVDCNSDCTVACDDYYYSAACTYRITARLTTNKVGTEVNLYGKVGAAGTACWKSNTTQDGLTWTDEETITGTFTGGETFEFWKALCTGDGDSLLEEIVIENLSENELLVNDQVIPVGADWIFDFKIADAGTNCDQSLFSGDTTEIEVQCASVETQCCTVRREVTATLSGGCCVGDQTLTLTYDDSDSWWKGAVETDTCDQTTVYVAMRCVPGTSNWAIGVSCVDYAPFQLVTDGASGFTVECDPFRIDGTLTNNPDLLTCSKSGCSETSPGIDITIEE